MNQDWQKLDTNEISVELPSKIEVRYGVHKVSYRLNYRKSGVSLRDVIKGEWKHPKKMTRKDWRALGEAAERMIHEAKYGVSDEMPAELPSELVRCEDIAQQLIQESETKGQAEKTVIGKKYIFGIHVRWYNQHCPYAHQLNVSTWPKLKAHLRAKDPELALENHVKYFRMLRKRAFQLGLIKQFFPVEFNLKKEEFRDEGQVISREEEKWILKAASQVWRDRSVVQRDTGMRPGEVRQLTKERVTFKVINGRRIATIVLREGDTKTRKARSFEVHSTRAVEVLWRRHQQAKGDSLFPMRGNPNRPMEGHLKGWHAALKQADKLSRKNGGSGVNQTLTPHDWRHTYADEMFKKVGPDRWSTLCYQLGMALKTAEKTYIHFVTSDTSGVASLAAEIQEDAPKNRRKAKKGRTK